MKKLLMILPLTMIFCFMVGCQDKEANVKRFMEDEENLSKSSQKIIKIRQESMEVPA